MEPNLVSMIPMQTHLLEAVTIPAVMARTPVLGPKMLSVLLPSSDYLGGVWRDKRGSLVSYNLG